MSKRLDEARRQAAVVAGCGTAAALRAVRGMRSLTALRAALAMERVGQGRSAVVAALAERIAKLQGGKQI